MEALVRQKKILVLPLVKQRQKFAWVYIIMGIVVIFLLTQIKTLSLKVTMETLTYQFWLGSICNRFYATEFREVALGGNVSVFSVDYNAVDNSDILNIHKYLMFKNNIKINLKI